MYTCDRRSRVWIGISLILVTGNVVGAETESVESLKKDRVVIAMQWWTDVNSSLDPPAYAEYFRAAAALRDAQYDAAKDRNERVKALAGYRDRIEALANKIETLFKLNAAGGESNKRDEARYLLLSARLRIKEEEKKN